jgi:hypothetical protein
MAVEFVFDVVIESSPRLLKALYTGLVMMLQGIR